VLLNSDALWNGLVFSSFQFESIAGRKRLGTLAAYRATDGEYPSLCRFSDVELCSLFGVNADSRL